MNYLTLEEFHTVVVASSKSLAKNCVSANCDNWETAQTALEIHRNLCKLYNKVSRKAEGTISTGKVCRCIAKAVYNPNLKNLFTVCFRDFPDFNPVLADYTDS